MTTNNSTHQEPDILDVDVKKSVSRRNFLGYVGGASALIVAASACSKGIPVIPPMKGHPGNGAVNLGSGDVGILNYAYTLEQIEAAFYTIVIASPYFGISSSELSLIADIRDHEIAHREFFKNALGSSAIPALDLDFSSINFSSRTDVLNAAKTFEDLGVSAYNGAGQLIVNPDYLTLAGKIVSVEARHAAYIRDIISYGSFADSTVLNANGLDTDRTPAVVLQAAGMFVKNSIDASNLPTS